MYTYQNLKDDIAYLAFNGADVGHIGSSTLFNPIPFIHAGDYSDKQIIVTGAIHARENITALLVIKQAFHALFVNTKFSGGIYFLPMINPDGALLIEKGTEIVDKAWGEELTKINGNSDDFSLWKANINGVDLNNNFDARFGCDDRLKSSPAPNGYAGEFPFCEKESNLLKQFTQNVRPCATISYHALGREVYYSFFQDEFSANRDKNIASTVANQLNYELVHSDMGSTGGYKDWCIEKLKIPALTIEIISSEHTHPLSDGVLEEDWEQNKSIPQLILSLI